MESDRSDHSPATKQDFTVKQQPVQPKRIRIERKLRKKTNCPTHMQRLSFKCAEEGCQQPYMCLHADCLQTHFHNATLKVTKIDIASFEQKFEQTQNAMSNSEKLFGQAFQIKAIIDSLKNSVTALFKDVGGMGRTFGQLKAEVDTVLTNTFLGKIQEALKIQNRISASIQRIKSKINLNPTTPQQPEPLEVLQQSDPQPEQHSQPSQQQQQDDQFPMKNQVKCFLQANINNFDWKTAITVINTKEKEYTCTQFHAELANKPNLIFLFIAEGMVIGSYFSSPYPNESGVGCDPTSFIFTVTQDPLLKILKFLANSDCSHHIQVNQQWYVCQGHLQNENEGIRLHKNSMDNLQISLPTNSYVAENISEENINENIKLLQILVLQVEPINL